MSIRVIADGKFKLTLLKVAPAVPSQPTVAELTSTTNAIDLAFKVTADNFDFGPQDSDKNQEKALGTTGNAQALGASNGQCAFNIWRLFATAGGFDTTDDAAFAALMSKGTTVWLYGRQTEKLASAAWATGDEVFYGCETVTDRPQKVDGSGFIKYRIPTEVQNDWTFIKLA